MFFFQSLFLFHSLSISQSQFYSVMPLFITKLHITIFYHQPAGVLHVCEHVKGLNVQLFEHGLSHSTPNLYFYHCTADVLMTQACSTLLHLYYLTAWHGTCCQWKAQSVVSKTSSALTELSASLFHHRPPTSLFSSLALSPGLWSPAVLDSLSALKSSLALLACQAAEGTNGYLRSWAPLTPPTSTSLLLPTNILLLYQNFSVSSHCSQLPIPYFSPFNLPPVSNLLPHSSYFFHFISMLLPTLQPLSSSSSAGYLGIRGGLCSAEHRAVLFWSGTSQAFRCAFVCVPFGRHSAQQQELPDKH